MERPTCLPLHRVPSAADIAAYERDGFHITRQLFPAEEIAGSTQLDRRH